MCRMIADRYDILSDTNYHYHNIVRRFFNEIKDQQNDIARSYVSTITNANCSRLRQWNK